MSQMPSSYPSMPPSMGLPPAAPPPPPGFGPGGPGVPGGPGGPGGGYRPPMPPQVIHIVSKPGGLTRALGTVLGLFLFAGTFIVGLLIGIFVMFAGTSIDDVVLRETYRDGGSQTVAIIPVMGVIDDQQSQFVHAAVNNVLDDDSVKAVVLRVDSPGGGVTASDQIWYEVNRLKDAGLPVVASYGSMAASGGYYISCGADHIIAEETCITGSIGVIAQVLTMGGLMEKVGIEPVTLVAGGSPEKDAANDMFRPWTERDKEKLRIMLDAAYATFSQRVKDGRAHVISDPSKIDAVANGSIYTAQQALEAGLIDGVGYLDDAIAQAEQFASIATGRAHVETVRLPPTLFGDDLFLQSRTNGKDSAAALLDAERIRSLVNDLSAPRVMYLMK